MVWQRSGTVAVQNGSTTVVGTNVDFAASSRNGDSFIGPDGATYEVSNVASATVISILPAYKGPTVSGAGYAIMPVQGYDKMLSDAFNALVNQFGTKLAALGTTGNYDTLPVNKGGTGGTDQAAAQIALGLQKAFRDSAKAGEVLTVGHAGWNGGFAQVQGNGADCNLLINSMIYALNGTYTNGPASFVGNPLFLRNMVHGTGYLYQEAVGITQPIRAERICVNGAWGAWRVVYNDFNAGADPAAIGGGINSRTVISGVVVNKFISGLMIMNGTFTNTSSCPANMVSTVSITVPANTGVDSTFTNVAITCVPTIANDFALMLAYMSSQTLLTMVIKNGASAQAFGVKGIIMSHWK